MRLWLFCMALSLGVVAFAHPEGEASAVADPAPAEGEAAAAADPKPAEPAPSQDETARNKRWYYYYPNSYNFGYGYPWNFNQFNHLRSSGGPTGRTRSDPYTASFEELMEHNRWNDYNHQQWVNNQQQWMNNQQQFGNNPQNFGNQFDRNLPDVIDTASPAVQDAADVESRTRLAYANANSFGGNFPNRNFGFNPGYQNNFGPFSPHQGNFHQGRFYP